MLLAEDTFLDIVKIVRFADPYLKELKDIYDAGMLRYPESKSAIIKVDSSDAFVPQAQRPAHTF